VWNGEFRWPVHNDQFYPDVVIGLLLLWMVVSFRKQHEISMWIGAALLALWVGVHLNDWWIPYLMGTGPERDGFLIGFMLPVANCFRQSAGIDPQTRGTRSSIFFVFGAFLLGRGLDGQTRPA